MDGTSTERTTLKMTMMSNQQQQGVGDNDNDGSDDQQPHPVTEVQGGPEEEQEQQRQHVHQRRLPHTPSISEEPDDNGHQEEEVVDRGQPYEVQTEVEEDDVDGGGGGYTFFEEAKLRSGGMAAFTSSTASVESNWHNNNSNNNRSSHRTSTNRNGSTSSLESTWNSVRVGLHRRRTLYLIRHGEAVHNVLEAEAQAKARREAEEMNLSPEQTWEMMEEARMAVLSDESLRDAPLTDKGREQAREAAQKLQKIIDTGILHAPTEAMCSPLSRCLETCKILLENAEVRAHIRLELAERKTQYPADTAKPLEELLRCTSGDDRFVVNHIDMLSPEKVEAEAAIRESREMLRQRAGQMFDLLMEMEHRHVLVVSHKGFLRELERGLLEIPDSPLFGNCELRVYRVIFTMGDRQLYHLERLH